MKLNRLIETTMILLQKRSVTARELSERFGVSIRTIYRDIETLSTSGVPIYTSQGQGGGISLMDEYQLDRTALSDDERDSLLAAVSALGVTQHPQARSAFEKLSAIFGKTTDYISVDYEEWGAPLSLPGKFDQIKDALLTQTVIEFDYIDMSNNMTHRQIEPLHLLFKSRAWYVWGYCRLRESVRLFRLPRMKRVQTTSIHFERKAEHEALCNQPEVQTQINLLVKLQFEHTALVRLCDDFDVEEIEETADGKYIVHMCLPEDEWIFGYVLSYGADVRVLEPAHIRSKIAARIKKMSQLY